MAKAGQFLVDPSAFLGWFSKLGVAGVVLLLITLWLIRARYLLRLTPGLKPGRFALSLSVGCMVGIGLTILLTLSGATFFGLTAELTGAEVDSDGIRFVRVDPAQPHLLRSDTARIAVAGLESARRNRAAQIVLVLALLLLVVGAGYAFTLLRLSFLGHLAAFSAGVALPEELTKALAGLMILYGVLDTKQMPIPEFRRWVFSAFAIAGLGFGAGEALGYFGAYARNDVTVIWYAVRATWCVVLHGAWTLLVGGLLSERLPQDFRVVQSGWKDGFLVLLVACLPSVLLHGLYDACCLHGEVWPWIIGALSLAIALAILSSVPVEQQMVLAASGGADRADVIAASGSRDVRRLADVFARPAQEITLVGKDTWAYTGRLCTYSKAIWDEKRLRRVVLRAQRDVRPRLSGTDLNDELLAADIASLREQISLLERAGYESPALQNEIDKVARLQDARAGLHVHARAKQEARSRVGPRTLVSFGRIAVGYGAILSVLVLAAIVLLGTGSSPSRQAKSTNSPPGASPHSEQANAQSKSSSGVVISAAALVNAFKENSVAAVREFLGKRLDVTGTIARITPPADGLLGREGPVLYLQSGTSTHVECRFPNDAELSNALIGQSATVRGFCQNGTRPILYSCSVGR
jgi:hypothetical protein